MQLNYIEDCRASYFNEIFSKSKSIGELIEFYRCYTGPIYADQIDVLLSEINQRDEPQGAPKWSQVDLLESDMSLGSRACEVLQRTPNDIYLQPIHDIAWSKAILPGSVNQHRSIILPWPLSQRLAWNERPQFDMHAIAANAIFLTPNGFCALDSSRKAYWPLAASRKYPRLIAEGFSGSIAGPAVLIQDQYDGGNFAHFLFDWVTRIFAFVQHVPDAREYTFLMGGKKTEFHREIVSCICRWLNLSEANFYWPSRAETLGLPNGVVIFSDSKFVPAHPAQMWHDYAADIIATLGERLKISAASVKKIYVSRGDAALRKLTNELEIVRLLESRGYTSIRLADLSVRDQFSVMAGARSVIAPHGMGLTHIALRSGALDILELFHPGIGSDAYAFLASAKQYCYAPLIGHAINDDKAGFEVAVSGVSAYLSNMA